MIAFLLRCIKALNPRGGLLVAKENIAEEDMFDDNDSSITRCTDSLLRLFKKAGLRVIKQVNQENWPQDLFNVTM